MEINLVKTNCMVFPSKRAEAKCLSSVSLFRMGDDEIVFCDECKYLGHVLATDLNDKMKKKTCRKYKECIRE